MTPIDGLGCNPGWEIRDCRECGAKTKFPAKIVENLGLGDVGAICDECELEQRRQADEEAMQANIEQLIDRAKIPPLPAVESLHPAARQFIDAKRTGLFLYGPPGSTKTRTASTVVRMWCRERRRAYYITEKRYFEASYNNQTQSVKRAKSSPLLVIDDLGKDYESDWSAGEFFSLVDERYMHDRKTIFVSNFSPQVLAGTDEDPENQGFKHFDDATMRRIAEMCVEPLHMT